MFRNRLALKAIFSTANLNGTAATLMSVDMGSQLATALYISAVAAGTYNKYHGLTKGDEGKKNILLRSVTHPSITAATFMLAAMYNFYDSTHDLFTQPSDQMGYNLLRMGGWAAGFLGDNALRRLDRVNFKQNAEQLGGSLKSSLSRTFNALVSNPTIFYGLASTGFVLAELAHRYDGNGKNLPIFYAAEGKLGAATSALVGLGIAYAARNTWRAIKGEITHEQINDGVMNYMSSAAKIGYTVLAAATGYYGLAGAHLIFTASNIKVIYETRSALSKRERDAPAPTSMD